jgi:hypothetical protein
MKFLMNIALGAVLISNAICLKAFYGSSHVGFVVLMGFTFMGIVVVIAANQSDL